MSDGIETNPYRFVRMRCLRCNTVSPVCDQQEDIHRSSLSEWWQEHVRVIHAPRSIIERVTGEGVIRGG